MSGNSININCVALSKMILHAARYSHLAVNGVLLGPPTSGKEASDIFITDAVPLFHHTLALTPMLDVALTQIEERYMAMGLEVLGYYQANENVREIEPDFIATKIIEKIADNCSAACLVMIDNRAMSLNLESSPLIVSQMNPEGRLKAKDKTSVVVESSSLRTTSQLLQRHIQHEVTDFDQHLDDISLDWANSAVNKLVDSYEAA